MIDWAKIEKVLEKWYTHATGLKMVWSGQSAVHLQRAYGELSISSTVGIGVDENIVTYDSTKPTGRELVRTACGNRQFTLGCKVVSRDARPTKASIYYMEKVRTSLHKPSTIALFETAELSVATILASVDSLNPYQKREENWSIMDVRMNTVANETDAREEGGYIDKTLVTSDLDGLPDDLQLDDKEIPTP